MHSEACRTATFTLGENAYTIEAISNSGQAPLQIDGVHRRKQSANNADREPEAARMRRKLRLLEREL